MKKWYYIIAPLLIVGLIAVFPRGVFATTETFTASGTWVAPAGVTSVNAEVWAGGGGGSRGSGGGNTGGGGGGGAYSIKSTITVVPGNSYTYVVGTGGTGGVIGTPEATDGGDSFFCNSTSNCVTIAGSAVQAGAKGGKGGVGVNAHGVGGASASGFGDTKYSGGDGVDGDGSIHGGGGGGGAGSTGIGGNASGATGGTGTSLSGGNGGNEDASGNTAGGGGGGASTGNGGAGGARGQIKITYTASSVSIPHATATQSAGTITQMQGIMVLP